MDNNEVTKPRLLIVGGCGYVGNQLTIHLHDLGYPLEIVDNCWFDFQMIPGEIPLHKRDVSSLDENFLKDFDQIIFLGGLSNDPMAEFSPDLNYVYNAAHPAALAYKAKRAGVKKFIFASSCSVYGDQKEITCTEQSHPSPQFPYGISKLQAEKGLTVLDELGKFQVIILRKGTISGYSNRMRFDLIVNTMFRDAMTKNVITVSNPNIWRPILDIEDAIQAYERAIEYNNDNEDCSDIFNIASENLTVYDTAKIVQEALSYAGKKDIEIDIKNIPDKRNYRVDFTRAKSFLGFNPNGTVESIIISLFRHMDEFGDMYQDKYYNIKVFKEILK